MKEDFQPMTQQEQVQNNANRFGELKKAVS